jgi:uncharacterized membrane protein
MKTNLLEVITFIMAATSLIFSVIIWFQYLKTKKANRLKQNDRQAKTRQVKEEKFEDLFN